MSTRIQRNVNTRDTKNVIKQRKKGEKCEGKNGEGEVGERNKRTKNLRRQSKLDS
jgi:hypothetical protein